MLLVFPYNGAFHVSGNSRHIVLYFISLLAFVQTTAQYFSITEHNISLSVLELPGTFPMSLATSLCFILFCVPQDSQ